MTSTSEHLDALARAFKRSATGAVVLTGAGISIPSGVPGFRSSGGLWERYDPMEYATIQAFRADPEKVWTFLRDLDGIIGAARPNPGHHALADLEHRGFVQLLITQNVDALHQSAGSQRVVELHGSADTLSCLACGAQEHRTTAETRTPAGVPHCLDCDGVMKPDVIFFGEDLPRGAYQQAEHAVRTTDLVVVVGTSAEVEPAASLPRTARHMGAVVWEVNPDPCLPNVAGSVALPAEEALPAIVDRLLGRGPIRRVLARQRDRRR